MTISSKFDFVNYSLFTNNNNNNNNNFPSYNLDSIQPKEQETVQTSQEYQSYWSGLSLEIHNGMSELEQKIFSETIDYLYQLIEVKDFDRFLLVSLIDTIKLYKTTYKEKLMRYAYLIFIYEHYKEEFFNILHINHKEWIRHDIVTIFCNFMEPERKVIKNLYKKFNVNGEYNYIPSTLTHNLLHHFSNILISENNKLNIGGIFLLQKCVHYYFKDESRTQILAVLNQLESDLDFQKNVNEDFIPHVDVVQEFWTSIMKDPLIPSKKCEFKRVLLIGLMKDLRQHSYMHNCYAISSMLYLIHNKARTLFLYYKQLFSEGYISNSNKKLSLKFLYNNNNIDVCWVNKQIPVMRIIYSPVAIFFTKYFGVDMESIQSLFLESSLSHLEFIQILIKHTKPSALHQHYKDILLDICHSFQINRIQFISISALIFQTENSLTVKNSNGSNKITKKKFFLRKILTYINDFQLKNLKDSEYLKSNSFLFPIFEKYSNELLGEILLKSIDSIFLELNDNPSMYDFGDKIFHNGKFIEIGQFNNKIDLIKVLSSFFVLKIKFDYIYNPIKVKSIKEFQTYLLQIIYDTLDEYIISGIVLNEHMQLFKTLIIQELANYVLSSSFHENILKVQQKCLSDSNIKFSLEDLYLLENSEDFDFLCFHNNGSSARIVMEEVFKMPFSLYLLESSSPKDFLCQFIEYCKKPVIQSSLKPEEIFIVSYHTKSGGHLFTFQPYRYIDLITSFNSFAEYMDYYMTSRSNALLSNEISFEKKNQLAKLYIPEKLGDYNFNLFINSNSNARAIKDFFLNYLPVEKHKSFYRSFNSVLREVSIHNIIINQESFLEFAQLYDIKISHNVLIKFCSIFEKDFRGNEFSILHLAYTLQKAARYYNEPLNYIYKIEQMLIEYYDLPRIIDLADLNTTEERITENPIHCRLIAKIDLINLKPTFFIRSRYDEDYFPESQEKFYERVNIVLPIK